MSSEKHCCVTNLPFLFHIHSLHKLTKISTDLLFLLVVCKKKKGKSVCFKHTIIAAMKKKVAKKVSFSKNHRMYELYK